MKIFYVMFGLLAANTVLAQEGPCGSEIDSFQEKAVNYGKTLAYDRLDLQMRDKMVPKDLSEESPEVKASLDKLTRSRMMLEHCIGNLKK